MGRRARDIEDKEESVLTPEEQMEQLLKDTQEDHLNNYEDLDYKISSGSLNLDAKLSGGYGPGFHRFCGHNNSGKALVNWAKVLTPDGWREIGSLTVGDYVYGSDGKVKSVLGVYPQGKKDYYKITFNDGAVTHCTLDHLWYTETLLDRAAKRKGSAKSLSEIIESLHRITLNGKQLNHSIPTVKPIEFETKNHYIHPYVLGVLLGDGSFGEELELSNSQMDIIDKISKLLPDNYQLKKKINNRPNLTFSITKIEGTGKNAIKEEIKRLGLFGKDCYNKFIPTEYLFSSVNDRIELLRGLLDTDASVDKRCPNEIEFSTASVQLAQNVIDLARSLGSRVTASRKDNCFYTYKEERILGAVSYRIRINFNNNSIIPVSSKKRLSIYKPRQKRKARCIKSVEKMGVDECTCIKVDSEDSLFVTDDYLLTHNTPAAIELQANFLAYHKANKQKARGILIRAEGRLNKAAMQRTGLKYVLKASEWTDWDSVLVINCQKYETICTYISEIVNNNPTGTLYNIIIDSMDGLKVKADEGKLYDANNKVAGAPALSKRFLTDMSLEFNIKGHQGILISQVVSDIKIDPYAKTVPKDGQYSGGNALNHYANWILEFVKLNKSDMILDTPSGKINDGKSKVIGHPCKVIITKAMNEEKFSSVEYAIKHNVTSGSAIWMEQEIVDQLLQKDYVKKAGAWLKVSDMLLVELKEQSLEMPEQIQGMEKLRTFLENNKPVAKYLFNKFRNQLIMETSLGESNAVAH